MIFIRATLLALTCVPFVHAQKYNVDEEAKAILQEFIDQLTQQESLSSAFSLHIKVDRDGQNLDESSLYKLAYTRPNKLNMIVEEGRGVSLNSDGDELTAYIPDLKQYRVTKAPDHTEKILTGDPVVASFSGGATAFLWMFLGAEDRETFMSDITWIINIGSEEFNGVTCDRIFFNKRNIDMNVWISREGRNLMKVQPDLSKIIKARGGSGEMSMVLAFSDWSYEVADDRYSYTVPEEAEKVTQFRPMSAQQSKDKLLGQPAPGFELERLEGGQVALADHKDKDVVVLDFWATWCGPCRMTMPQLMELEADYNDKSVVFYAMNLREDKEHIRAFLEKYELKLNVIMDIKGQTGKAYGTSAIPQTVVIGKDGTVQSVHIGFDPKLKDHIRSDVDALLAGRSLINPHEGDDL